MIKLGAFIRPQKIDIRHEVQYQKQKHIRGNKNRNILKRANYGAIITKHTNKSRNPSALSMYFIGTTSHKPDTNKL